MAGCCPLYLPIPSLPPLPTPHIPRTQISTPPRPVSSTLPIPCRRPVGSGPVLVVVPHLPISPKSVAVVDVSSSSQLLIQFSLRWYEAQCRPQQVGVAQSQLVLVADFFFFTSFGRHKHEKQLIFHVHKMARERGRWGIILTSQTPKKKTVNFNSIHKST